MTAWTRHTAASGRPFKPAMLFFALPLAAAFLLASPFASQDEGSFVEHVLLLTASALICAVALLLLTAGILRTSGRVPMLPAFATLACGLAVWSLKGAALLPDVLAGGSAIFVAAAFIGVGAAMAVAGWGRAFVGMGFTEALLCASLACTVAGCLVMAIIAFLPGCDTVIVSTAAIMLSLFPLELLNAVGASEVGGAREAGGAGEAGAANAVGGAQRAGAASEASGAREVSGAGGGNSADGARSTTGRIKAAWKPLAGLSLCWVLIGCNMGTALAHGSPMSSSMPGWVAPSGILLSSVLMTLAAVIFRGRPGLLRAVMRMIPAGAIGLLLLTWVLTKISIGLVTASVFVINASTGMLVICAIEALCQQAALGKDLAVRFSLAGLLALLAVSLAVASGWLLVDLGEFLTPLLTLCYLVGININLSGAAAKQAAAPRTPSDFAASDRLAVLAKEAGLSPREAEVLGYLAEGYSAPHIAQALFISSSSVKTHTRRVYGKLGIHKRDQLIALVNSLEK
jgi:DNA-binding CsgD family transcriptional regulator